MGGRYGKYGENKRFARLRKAGPGSARAARRKIEASGFSARQKTKPISKNHVRIKPARVTDASHIRNLSKQVFRRYGPYDETLAHWFLSGMTITVMASMGGKAVGFAMLGLSALNSPSLRVYELLAIAVEPEMQNMGIGNLLLKEIETKAGELGAEKLTLHTAVDNIKGRKLFNKNGFIPSDTKRHFYPEGQDALRMDKDFV
jgi:ribosomal-protein-alanine N-acetyltransferase